MKSTHSVLNYTVCCFHEIFSSESKFLVFPHCLRKSFGCKLGLFYPLQPKPKQDQPAYGIEDSQRVQVWLALLVQNRVHPAAALRISRQIPPPQTIKLTPLRFLIQLLIPVLPSKPQLQSRGSENPNTGPIRDHSSFSSNRVTGAFAYIDASSPRRPHDKAHLVSSEFQATDADNPLCLR